MGLDFTGLNFFHRTGIQVRFNDIDVLQHVNNTVYQNYFDSARFMYFKQVMGIDRFSNDLWVVLATISIDFVEPVLIDDFIEVQTKVSSIGTKSLTMHQQIAAMDGSGQRIKTRTSSVLVGYNLDTGKTVPIPEIWKEKIINYERDINFT